MILVKAYGLKTSNETNFDVDFSIPDNCQYSDQLVSGTYIVTVQLKKGYTQPSTTYITCSINLNAIDNDIKVNFNQILDGKVTTKPKITIENC